MEIRGGATLGANMSPERTLTIENPLGSGAVHIIFPYRSYLNSMCRVRYWFSDF